MTDWTDTHLKIASDLLAGIRAQHEGANVLIGTEQAACQEMAIRILRDVASTSSPAAIPACNMLISALGRSGEKEADRWIAWAAVLGNKEWIKYINESGSDALRAQYESELEEFNADFD